MIKLLAVVVAGVLTVLTIRRIMQQLSLARVKAKVERPSAPRAVTRLRQDPSTGVYYPER
jgi:hypothetical protein